MKGHPNDLRHLRCSLFLVMKVLLYPCFCAAEDACNDEGGGSSAGRRSVKMCFFFPFLFLEEGGSESGGVFQQLWESTADQHQRGGN